MSMGAEIREQLMAMAGIKDPADFDRLVRELAPQVAATAAATDGQGEMVGISATERANLNCPFKLHFLRMTSLLESPGNAARLRELTIAGDTRSQIQHCFKIIVADKDFADLGTLFCASKSTNTDEKAAVSKSARDRGNKLYSKRSFASANAEYTASIVEAPFVDRQSREAALGLGNRSALFFQTGRFEDCLQDICTAFDFGYPAELAYKLHDRRGRCHLETGKAAEAREDFKKAIDALDEANVKESKKNELKKELQDAISKVPESKGINGHEDSSTKEDDFPCPFDVWERHPNFPVLADSLKVAFNDQVGRHVLATKAIRAGEPIVIEDPVSSHLSPYRNKLNCTHCFRLLGDRSVPSPLSPDKCRFCRPRCLRRALDSYHRIEAEADIADIFYGDDRESQLSGCISLAYRAVTQRSLDWFKSRKEALFTCHDIKFGLDVKKDYSYTGEEHYRGLFNLVNHLERATENERISLLVRTIVLIRCLRASGYFPGVKERFNKPGGTKMEKDSGADFDRELSEDELLIAKLLFHFQAGIQYNLHAIYQVDGPLEAGKRIPLLDIGAGCYPTTLFFNHSCAPNTVRINQGTRVVFFAKRNIRAGEEVTECYGIHHLSLSRAARQESLAQGYRFDCACAACRDDLPDMAGMPAQVTPRVAVKLGTPLSKYKSLFDEGKFPKALSCCQEYLFNLEELGVAFPHRNYEVASMAMCSCLWAVAKDA